MNLFANNIEDEQDEEVRGLQQTMFDAGIDIKVDGIYGSKTDAAAIQYAKMANPVSSPAEVAPQVATVTTPAITPPVANQQKTQIDPNSYLGGLLAAKPKAPKYAQKNEYQLKEMAKAQKFGELMGLLGDVYGLSKGAPIQRRESTSAAPYMQQIMANQEKHRQDLENYDRGEYARKLQIGKAYDDNKDKERGYEMDERKMGIDAEYKAYLRENKEADTKLSRDKFVELQRHNQEIEKTSQIRANNTGKGAANKEDKPVIILTDKQVYELTKDEADLYKDKMLKHMNDNPDKYKGYFTQQEVWPAGTMSTRKVPGTGTIVNKLNPEITDDILIRDYIKMERESVPDDSASKLPTIQLPGTINSIQPQGNKANTGGLY